MRDNGPVTQKEYILPKGLTIVSRTDLQGNIQEANEAFIEASGYDWTELVGQPHNILRHPDVPAAVFKDFWETLKLGKPWSQTVKNRRKNGDHYWVIANATPIFENGKVSGFMSVRTPATTQQIKEAQAAYQAIAAGKIHLKHGKPISLIDSINPLKHFELTHIILVLCSVFLFSAYAPKFIHSIPEVVFEALDLLTLVLIWLSVYLNGKHTQEMSSIITAISEGKFDNNIELSGNNLLSNATGRLKSMQIKLGADFEEVKEALDSAKRIERALYSSSANVMVADRFRSIIFMNQSMQTMLRDIEADLQTDLPNFKADNLLRQNIDVFHKNPHHQQDLLENLTSTHNARIKVGTQTLDLIVDPIFDDHGRRIGTVTEWKNMTEQLAIEDNIAKIVADASRGILKNQINTTQLHGFEQKLSISINDLIQSFRTITQSLSRILTAMSDGDLTGRMSGDYEGEVLAMQVAVNNALKNLEVTLGHVKIGSTEIGNMSHEVSQASDDLSQRTQEQAASLEQTAASMEQLTATIKQSSDNAEQANRNAKQAALKATEGIEVMSKTLAAMQGIGELSQKIGDITSVIDGIAFQTNLLALNAAVEAARAGDHGRGFAVVAGEVRNLAQKSAESSKEISNLISSARKQIQLGTDLVAETNRAFDAMVSQIKEVEDLVTEVSNSSAEQALGVSQINQAVMQLDQMTQQNAALVEELSATAGNMHEQATTQAKFVSRFKINPSAVRQSAEAADVQTIDFEDAKMKHRAWNVKLEQLLAGNEVDLDKQSARKNNVCPLGKWLYGDGQKFAHLSEMQDLISLHSEMHEVVGRVIDAYDLNDLDMAHREKDRVHKLSNKIIATIDLVKHHVAKDSAAAKSAAKAHLANVHPAETPTQIAKPAVSTPSKLPAHTTPKPLPKPSKPAKLSKDDDEWDDF